MGTEESRVQGTEVAYVSGDNPEEWPDELDATVAAAQHHEVMFENEHVRVVQVYIEPGDVEVPHHHRWPSVLCLLEGRYLVDHNGATDEVVFDTREFGGLEPMRTVVWKEPEALHYVKNPSETDVLRLVRVELKSVPPANPA